VFAVGFANNRSIWALGVAPYPPPTVEPLAVTRGGLDVPVADRDTYDRLVAVLRQRVTTGTILAGPDSPEVYFLAGFENPTPAFFDVLSPALDDDR